MQSPTQAFPDALPDGNITVTLVQSDGSILVGGDFSKWSGTKARYLVRLFPDGSLDMEFVENINVINGWSQVRALAVQSDGRILVGGSNIRRLLNNGTLDTSFVPEALPLQAWSVVNSIVVQPDGRILVGGESRTFPNPFLPSFGFVSRIHPSGSRDTSFRDLIPRYDVDFRVNLGSILRSYSIGGSVQTLVVEPSGHILVGGFLYSWHEFTVGDIVRLNPSGDIDLEFTNAVRAKTGTVNAMSRLTSGEIIVGTGSGLARIDSAGSVFWLWRATDNESVLALAVLPDNRLFVGGKITKWGDQEVSNLVKIDSNGLLDRSFDATQSLAPIGKVTGITLTPLSSLIATGVLVDVLSPVSETKSGSIERPFRSIERFDSDGQFLRTRTPGLPKNPRARAVPGGAVVSWNVPASTGGLTIESYSVVASPSGKKCAWKRPRAGTTRPLRCTISGLRRGKRYVFVVKARNQVGTSAVGAKTNYVIGK